MQTAAILNVNLSVRKRRMQALKSPFNMQQNCTARNEIEGLSVLWLIFNLSRLYPMITAHTAQEAHEGKEVEVL